MAQPTEVTATIRAGEFLSEAVDVTDGQLLRIVTPDQWNPANLTFQIASSNDEVGFRDLYSYVSEIMLPVQPGRCMALPPDAAFARDGFIKLRSGRSASPVPQDADRVFTLVLLPRSQSSVAPLPGRR